jgi:O-acetylserine/cysteine efflux transporter
LSPAKIIGLVISIIGLMLIFKITDGSVTTLGLVFAFIAAISLSLVGLIIKKTTIPEMFAFVVWSCIFASIPLFILSYFIHGLTEFQSFANSDNLLGIFSAMFQAYPVTLLGYWLWNRLTVLYPMSTLAPLTLLIPIFGFIGSVLFHGEVFGAIKAIAFLVITLGLVIILADKKLMTFFQSEKLLHLQRK